MFVAKPNPFTQAAQLPQQPANQWPKPQQPSPQQRLEELTKKLMELVKQVELLAGGVNSSKPSATTAPQGAAPTANTALTTTAAPAAVDPATAALESVALNMAAITRDGITKPFINGKVIIDPQINAAAGELFKGKVANAFNPQWQQIVAAAQESLGSLGNAEQGYLAWSKEGHFVLFKNPDLTPEQNQKLAEISLLGGFAVEDLPGKRSTADYDDQAEFHKVVDEFVGRHTETLEKFLANPSAGYHVSNGRDKFVMQADPTSGMVGSYHFKKAKGIKGFFQKVMKWANPVLDLASTAMQFIPGWGQVGSLITKGVQTLGNWAATGKAKFGDLVKSAVDYFSAGSSSMIGKITQIGTDYVLPGLNTVGKYVGLGNLGDKVGGWISSGKDWLDNLTGGKVSEWLNKGASTAASAVATAGTASPSASSGFSIVKDIFAKAFG